MSYIEGFEELAKYLKLKDKRKAMDFATHNLHGKEKPTSLFGTTMIFDSEKVKQKLEQLYENESLDFSEASLYLGVTEDSLKKIVSNSTYAPVYNEATNRFLSIYLDEFIDRIIEEYRKKINRKYPILFSNLTRQRAYFVEAYNNITKLGIEIQYCEVANCKNIAYQYCCNRIDCLPDSKRRKICLAHGYMVDTKKPSKYHPDVICLECAEKKINGKLQSSFTFLESEDSVKKRIKEQKFEQKNGT